MAKHINSPAELEQLIKNTRVVVVDFFATWCGPCKAVAPLYEKLASQLSESGKMAFAKVDVDKQSTIAKANNVTAMPTFVVFKNGTETERVQGADPAKLTNIVKTLYAETGGDVIGSSNEWLAAEGPKGYSSVSGEIDIKGLDIMNAKSELGGVRMLFSGDKPSDLSGNGGGKGKAKSDGSGGNGADWVESDTDEQLMLFVPFSSTVKLFQLQITSLPKEDEDDDEAPKRPKTIKLYTNSPHILGFDDAESREETQLIEIDPDQWKNGTVVINTRFVKFQAVSTLTIFIVEAEDGAECVRVDRIRLIGEAGEKRDPGKLEKVSEDE